MKLHYMKIIKLTLLVLVLTVAFHSLISVFKSPHRRGLFRQVRRFADNLYLKIILTYGCSDRPKCYDLIAKNIAREKLNVGAGRSLYFLDHSYVPPTEVSIPKYFNSEYNENDEKPVVQAFDPRFTFAVYYEWISKNPRKPVPFHWSDWSDFYVLNSYIFLDKADDRCKQLFELPSEMTTNSLCLVDDYCVSSHDTPLGLKVTGVPCAHTKKIAKLVARSFLFSSFPSPSRLIFLTNTRGSYAVDVINEENDLKYSLLRNGMPEEVYKSKWTSKLDILKSYKTLLGSSAPLHSPVPEPDKVYLDASSFDVDANQLIDDLSTRKLSKTEQRYLRSLEYSTSTDSPVKSLFEAKILPSEELSHLGRHYDWRFFDGFGLGSDKQAIALHNIVRSFLKFCQIHGFVTWVAHGSLLSWYWNGLAFPWDLDADVQMPIRDLHRLAREFNQTLVLENAGHDLAGRNTKMDFNGMGSYFIDVGSSITHRNAGNGHNKIDARFIDIHSGLYVDITGLAVSEENPPLHYAEYPSDIPKEERKALNKAYNLFNCRNRMWASLEELSPLTKAVVDNEMGYVPHDFESLLTQEYRPKSITVPRDSGFEFVKNLRFWVRNLTIEEYLKHPQKWIHVKSGYPQGRPKQRGLYPDEDTENLLYDEDILREYVSTLKFTEFHESQRNHLLEDREPTYFKELGKYKGNSNLGKGLWDDAFMKKIAMKEWDRDDEVQKIYSYQNHHEEFSN